MIAVLEHELKGYFHSLTAYVFGAFLLLFIGIGSMLYNLQAAVSNFEFVLSFSTLVFVVIVPILTMRVLAEERKQRTDQLLYSLPLKIRDVVAGKNLAMVSVLAAPTLLLALIPPILSIYGTVNFAAAYGTLFAFFLMGCALIAIGMFFSSLTESQIIAAVLSFSALLVSLTAETISRTVRLR